MYMNQQKNFLIDTLLASLQSGCNKMFIFSRYYIGQYLQMNINLLITMWSLMVFSFLPKNVHFISKN